MHDNGRCTISQQKLPKRANICTIHIHTGRQISDTAFTRKSNIDSMKLDLLEKAQNGQQPRDDRVSLEQIGTKSSLQCQGALRITAIVLLKNPLATHTTISNLAEDGNVNLQLLCRSCTATSVTMRGNSNWQINLGSCWLLALLKLLHRTMIQNFAAFPGCGRTSQNHCKEVISGNKESRTFE
jgi:hypothetical protein